MAQAKYDQIFQTLHERIESGTYRFLELLPSENALAEEFGCTRNTVRKALALLVTQGYVQTMQGRGVQVISRPRATSTFLVGGIESLREAAERNRISHDLAGGGRRRCRDGRGLRHGRGRRDHLRQAAARAG